MNKRVSQDTAVNSSDRMQGPETIDRCFKCNNYLITLCQMTGNKIKYPISGPIPVDCPLPKRPEEE